MLYCSEQGASHTVIIAIIKRHADKLYHFIIHAYSLNDVLITIHYKKSRHASKLHEFHCQFLIKPSSSVNRFSHRSHLFLYKEGKS